MLFVAFPDSTSSSRLMVIVLLRGGGSLDAGGSATASGEAAEAGPVKTVLGAEEMFETEPRLDRGSAVVGAGSSAPIAGGSDESAGGSCDGRVTITVSPASLAIPPASARTSRTVTGRYAWYTIARCTAPTTVMGVLFLSFTLTLTCGQETRPWASSTSVIFCSVGTSVRPATCKRTGTKGIPMDPVWLTRTSRLSSFTSKTSTSMTSPLPIT